MGVENTLTEEGFASLLRWLDSDGESAGRKYEVIRARLIRIFVGRGCHEAEALADLTIDRVTSKVPSLDGTYEGDPALFFYGVARNVYLEWLRRQGREVPIIREPVYSDETEDTQDIAYNCLERCLEKLSLNLREMIVEYYREEKSAKIEHRRQMAKNLGISAGALQIKTSRVRARLLDCVRECINAA